MKNGVWNGLWEERMGPKKAPAILLFLVVTLFLTALFSRLTEAGEPIHLLGHRQGEGSLPEGWRPLTFPKVSRHTRYQLIVEEDRPIIHAESRQSASGIYRPLDLNTKVYSILSWCWKIDRIISKGDETRREGDDYAARVYVTFRFDPGRATFWERTKFKMIKLLYGEYPPKGALNYIWANRLPKGEAVPNAYTNRAQMIAVESGMEKVGQWVCEQRNVYDDYKRLFGEEPPALSGVAVMTDTDDTKEEATAYYADLVLHLTQKGRLDLRDEDHSR